MLALTEEELKLLNSLSDDLSVENYFFTKASNPKWFFPLKDKGYFSPKRVPQPRPTNKEGSFIISPWNVMPYLEKLSSEIKAGKIPDYSEPLLSIIQEVTTYRTESNEGLDNYNVWWGFVNILLNLPNSEIEKFLNQKNIKINDWLDVWMSSKFRSGIVETDIAKKLLPKFLTKDPEDSKVAEDIVNAVTQIVWTPVDESKREFLLGKKRKGKTRVEDYWLIESFKANSPRIGEFCSKSTIYLIADRFKQLLKADRFETHALVDFRDSTYRLHLERIENEQGVFSDFDYIFKIGTIQSEEVKQAGHDPFKLHDLTPKNYPVEFVLNNQKNKEEFCRIVEKKIKDETSQPLDIAEWPDLKEHLVSLYDSINDDYLYIHLKSLSHNPHVGYTDIEVIFLVLLRDVLKAKCEHDVTAGREILEKLISEEYPFPTFQRLALFILISMWPKYKEILWKLLDNCPNSFYEASYEVELFKVLQTYASKFEKKEKIRLHQLIEKTAHFIQQRRKDEEAVAYWKQKWYSAFLPDDYFQPLFDLEKEKTKLNSIEPPSEDEVEATWVGPGKSPLTKEEVLGTNNNDLIIFMNNFKPADRWGDGFTVEGFCETIKVAVKEKPEKFIEGLEMFVGAKTPYRYDFLNSIINGLENAWKEKQRFDIVALLKSIEKYTTDPSFEAEAKKSQGEDFARANHFWIINSIASFIKDIVNDDEREVSSELLDTADKVLALFLSLLPPEQDEDENYVSRALNTSNGRCIVAVVCLALRRGRLAKSKREEFIWDTHQYEALLTKGVIEAYTILGQYMPNCVFLNKNWVKQKIENFKSLSGESPFWQGFMEGYLFSGNVYHDLYEWMRAHYEKAIQVRFEKRKDEKLLVQHICIGYLIGKENLTDSTSLFRRLLEQWDFVDYQEIVNFFWSEARRIAENKHKTKEKSDNNRNKIIDFWRWAFTEKALLGEKLKENYERFLSGLTRLTVIFDEINEEIFQWLQLSAIYVDLDFNSAFFIEYLDRFQDKESLKFVALLYIAMLKKLAPTYDQKHIESIVQKLFENNYIKEARKICDLYGERNIHFLRPIYDNYKQKRLGN